MENRARDYYTFLPKTQFTTPSPTLPPPPPPSSSSLLSQYTTGLDSRISPSVLLIIAILAVIFFLSGILHLLIRFLLRPTIRDPEDSESVTVLHGQLQQLFQLHDAGVDQTFIDVLPVFLYDSIIGGGDKDPFDCAVCLCEFDPDDKLRLLPNCAHAFHIECIDTWLLSHSTCPLCRGSLLPPEFSSSRYSPMFLVLESGNESSREIVLESFRENSHLGFVREEENLQKEEVSMMPPPPPVPTATPPETKVVAVKLGKFRTVDHQGEGSSTSIHSSNIADRRCFSMGSFEYVMDGKSLLQVTIKPPEKKPTGGKIANRRRLAMSECDFHSQREGFDQIAVGSNSFSVSKTWFRAAKKENPPPVTAGDGKVGGSRTGSEFDCGSEFDLDVEVGSCNNGRLLSMREETPSFARRTLLWVTGRNHV